MTQKDYYMTIVAYSSTMLIYFYLYGHRSYYVPVEKVGAVSLTLFSAEYLLNCRIKLIFMSLK